MLYLTDTVIDQKMSLHGVEVCKLETTLIVIISREFVSKLLSSILISEAKSWRPKI